MGSNRDKQRLVDSVYFTIRLNCRIILENGNYTNFDSENFIFFENFCPSPPPRKNPKRKPAVVVVV